MLSVDPWHIRAVEPNGGLWCYQYGKARQGKPKVAGIPGLHLRLERRAAVALLLGLRRTHRLIHEQYHSWPWRRRRLAGDIECTELSAASAIRFSGTHEL